MKQVISRSAGFSLIELMVALVVMILVLVIGIPGISRLKSGGELTTTTNDLMAALNFARSEAVRRGDTVTVNQSAVDVDGDGDKWDDGWTINAGGTVIRVFDTPPAGRNVTANPAVALVTFDALGNVAAAGCFDIWVDGDSRVRSIPISVTGRVSSCKDTCANVTGDPTLCD